MPDIIELILADHRRIRRLASTVNHAGRHDAAAFPLAPAWRRLAELLDRHAEAEEEICYLPLFGRGPVAGARMQDAIADHDDIREAVREAALHPVASPTWTRAVTAALRITTGHIAREELGPLAGFARHATPQLRRELGRQWVAFTAALTRDSAAGNVRALTIPVPLPPAVARAGNPRNAQDRRAGPR